MLDLSKVEIGRLEDHIHVERYVNSLSTIVGNDEFENIADNIVICFYNRRDMCRYCRSTFSYIMNNNVINRKIAMFVDNMFDKSVFAHSHDNIPIQIYAFAKETTEL